MKDFIAKTLEKALNFYLVLDPESEQRLQPLQNKIITIELLAINLTLQLFFIDKKIEIKINENYPASTTIRGTPLRLLQMAISQDRKPFFADDVTIVGNIELGQQVIALFDQLEIDWEEQAAKVIGDIPAHQIGRFKQKITSFTRKTRNIFYQDTNEFLHEEINVVPPKEALQDFFTDVDILRMDVDRLEARVQQLQKNIHIKRGML